MHKSTYSVLTKASGFVAIFTLISVPNYSDSSSISKLRWHYISEYRDHPLKTFRADVYPQFGPIGELSREEVMPLKQIKNSFGSAVIVSPCYILTNRHVAFGQDLRPIPRKSYVQTFRIGVGKDIFGFSGSTLATPVLWGHLDITGSHDWAILKLDQCAGSLPQFGWVEPSRYNAYDLVTRKQKILIVGYSYKTENMDRTMLSGSVGIVTGIDKKLRGVEYSASAVGKESGAPGFTVEDGVIKLAVIHSKEYLDVDNPDVDTFDHWSEDRTNTGESVNEILNREDVKTLLDADKSRYNFVNPGQQHLAGPLPDL